MTCQITPNDHGLARDTGAHLIGTEWRYPTSHPWHRWRVRSAMYGVLKLTDMRGVCVYYTVDELHREMQRVEGGT